jgi:hypothetical protein
VFPVSPEKERALFQRMARLGVRVEDLEESFVRARGAPRRGARPRPHASAARSVAARAARRRRCSPKSARTAARRAPGREELDG